MIGGNLPGATRTLSIALYDQVQDFQYAQANRTALFLLAICLVALMLLYSLRRRIRVPGAATLSDALIPDPELADPVRPASNTPWLTVHLEHRFPSNGTGFHLHLAFSAYAQRTVVFGPSGSGKSSLLRAIAGLLKPDVATIQFHGTPVCDTRTVANQPPVYIPAEKRRVGLVMQSPAVFPHLTASGNVAFAMRGNDRCRAKRKDHAAT